LSLKTDAYLNEMGVTNRLRPNDVTTVLKTTKNPEDVPDDIARHEGEAREPARHFRELSPRRDRR
jgi:hypothetical protein